MLTINNKMVLGVLPYLMALSYPDSNYPEETSTMKRIKE
jgi:hypothetical protein